MAGRLIVFEGIDGSGKAVQIRRLLERLEEDEVRVMGYPDLRSDFGRMLKGFLKRKVEMDPKTQFLTFAADIMKDQEEVKRLLKEGRCVIMDRYLPSTVAYQAAHGFPFEKGVELVSLLEPIEPDVIILIDIDPKVAVERKMKKGCKDRHDVDVSLLKKVRRNYLAMARKGLFAKRWFVVDGEGSEEEVADAIWRSLSPFLQ